MQIHRNTDTLPSFRRAVVTIGTFDGVHTGHQQLLQQLKEEADRIDGETVIITFDPHPRKIIRGASGEIRLLNTLEEKIALLAGRKVDHLVIVPFTEVFSQLTAEQYVKEFLLEKFHPHTVIIGYDHQFGKGRSGNYQLLEEFSRTEGFELQEIPVHLSDAISVSSTRIREAIVKADVETANQLLGYAFFFSGLVVEGNKLGRTIGYPTANLQPDHPEKLIPGDGVYVVEAEVISESGLGSGSQTGLEFARGGQRLKGMMNIGMRPTVDGTKRVIEVHIFDFNQDIYGATLRIFLKKHLRGEQKFAGLEALKTQLATDKQNAQDYFR
ncbi:bifunctional riboflavin kinase/FAD synthetase [Flavitalea flava]